MTLYNLKTCSTPRTVYNVNENVKHSTCGLRRYKSFKWKKEDYCWGLGQDLVEQRGCKADEVSTSTLHTRHQCLDKRIFTHLRRTDTWSNKLQHWASCSQSKSLFRISDGHQWGTGKCQAHIHPIQGKALNLQNTAMEQKSVFLFSKLNQQKSSSSHLALLLKARTRRDVAHSHIYRVLWPSVISLVYCLGA